MLTSIYRHLNKQGEFEGSEKILIWYVKRKMMCVSMTADQLELTSRSSFQLKQEWNVILSSRRKGYLYFSQPSNGRES